MELHHFLAATEEQNEKFYYPFQKLIGVWLFGLWLGIQKIPERFFPEWAWLHKYAHSGVVKSVFTIASLMSLHFLLKEAILITVVPIVTKSALSDLPPPVHLTESQTAVEQHLQDSKKQLEEAEKKLKELREKMKSKHKPSMQEAKAESMKTGFTRQDDKKLDSFNEMFEQATKSAMHKSFKKQEVAPPVVKNETEEMNQGEGPMLKMTTGGQNTANIPASAFEISPDDDKLDEFSKMLFSSEKPVAKEKPEMGTGPEI